MIGLVVIVIAAVIALGIEGIWPLRLRAEASVLVNAVAWVACMGFAEVTRPIIAVFATWLLGVVGPAPIHLHSGKMLLPSLFLILVVKDLADYAVHVAQHRVPLLWRMHSFHHSEVTMNATTGYRHYWLEMPLVMAGYIPVALLFRMDAGVAIAFGLFSWVFPLWTHLNLKIGFGRWSWLLVSPQYHRIHHSNDPKDYDRNFAGWFALWDVLFRTYRRPKSGEFPDTGIDAASVNWKDAVVWPIRSWFTQRTTVERTST